jgi:phosphoglycolate phosphatase-like HAD superfamily hydrolase
MEQLSAILIDLDGALGDTRPLWNDWLAGAAKVLGVDPAALPADRAAAAAELDAAGAGNWRTLLERFAAERAPVYLRPNAAVSSALRRLAATNRPVGVFTDAPAELAQVAAAHLGATRRIAALETGSGALERLAATLGADAEVVRTRAQLVASVGRV